MPGSLLFDLDGTLSDPSEGFTRSITHALAMLGRRAPSPDALRRRIGPPLRATLRELLESDDAMTVEQAVALYRERYFETGLFENALYDGTDAMLARLGGEGYRMFVATSKTAGAARRIVDHFGLARYFDGVYGSDPSGALEDKAELLAHVIEVERLDAADCLMIGDRMHDVIAARHNGIAAVGVCWGFGGRDELVACGPLALCENAESLPPIIASWWGSRARSGNR
jgi:phosphoglycolate phosphatase